MKKRAQGRTKSTAKLHVLDTNVLMHDPLSLIRFEEHDIFLPLQVFIELDNNKRGQHEAARNSRTASRMIDRALLRARQDPSWKHAHGVPLSYMTESDAKLGKLFIQSEREHKSIVRAVGESDVAGDERIIDAALRRARENTHAAVILVSKDINVRILASARDVVIEDYLNDQVTDDRDHLSYAGFIEFPYEEWQPETFSSQRVEGRTQTLRNDVPEGMRLFTNQFVFHEKIGDLIVREISDDGRSAVFQRLRKFRREPVMGILARNREQDFALNILLDTSIHVVTLVGRAGTGKTLLALAAGLHLKERGVYGGIIATRATVPIGDDIGFLPGDERDKMGPWMGAIEDNLEVIIEANGWSNAEKRDSQPRNAPRITRGGETLSHKELERSYAIADLKSMIQIKSLSYMRGRTFQRKFFIVDEAQNLTPKQMKTLITRAGEGTKIVCMGNLAQVDTPYLTEQSSGLAYLVERFKGWKHYSHIVMPGVERSPTADYAERVL